MKFGVGQSVRRKEDDPLLRGAGRYIADAMPAGALARGGGALDARARAHHARCRQGANHAGRAADPYR